MIFDEEWDSAMSKMKWNHIVIWHAVFWLFFRNMPYLLNFSLPLSLTLLKTCETELWLHFKQMAKALEQEIEQGRGS